jgi:hypothetical protein
MTTYVLDIIAKSCYHEERGSYPGNGVHLKYFFKIDINGNVDISKTSAHNFNGLNSSPITKVLLINDNIPIPKYFISVIKSLINQVTLEDIETIEQIKKTGHHHLTRFNEYNDVQIKGRYWEIVVDIIKRIKQEVKELIENPQDNLDIKTQLDTLNVKTILQQENIVELEKKIENIQSAYFDVLNDNKKSKEIINRQNIKQIELEHEINILQEEINTMKQLEETRKHEQQKMEDLEKERLWIEYKRQKQNYNPLSL